MLETLWGVLLRIGVPDWMAEAACGAVETSAVDEFIVVGGGVQPIQDQEDRRILETAIAGRSDLLVTNNMVDFLPGARSDLDAVAVRANPSGRADVLLFSHSRLEHGLVIAPVATAKSKSEGHETRKRSCCSCQLSKCFDLFEMSWLDTDLGVSSKR